MEKQKAVMVVMNSLHTDARVQRVASAIQDICDLTVIGIGKDSGIQNYRQVLFNLNNRNGVLRYFDYLQKVKKYLKENEFQLFYAHDYFSAALVPWVKKNFPNKVVVYDSHELIFPARGFSTSKRDRFFCHFERKAINRADLVLCASNERSDLMVEYYKIKKPPLVVENISQLPIINDAFSKKLLEQCRIVFDESKSVLVYAGILSGERKIDKLIDIISKRENVSLLVIGDGPDRERLRAIATERIPGRYCFTGSLPYKYMGVLLQNCDVGYISYPTDSLNNTYCASNKIYEYASVELPMIAPENPTIRSFFDEFTIGVIDDDLGVAFDSIRTDIDQYKRNCKLFTATHQWSVKATQLKDLIEDLL